MSDTPSPSPGTIPLWRALICIVMGILLVLIVLERPELRQPLAAMLDDRPVRRVLMIGNSHTFYHNMPQMVGEIADSAESPVRFAITQHAIGGATFRDHWNNPEVQTLLQQPWDDIILQGGSSETITPANAGNFHTYGAKLAVAARRTGARVALYVTWPYHESYSVMQQFPQLRYSMPLDIQKHYRQLANATGVRLINVGERWQMLRRSEPGLPLYEDGNHATIQGSYLVALMVYRALGNGSLAAVRYVPHGVRWYQAQIILRTANW